MRYSILFIIVVILVSGFIAYFGDILGRRMGKKRLTLFNMRPKYTAIVVTTITGMIIAASVLALLLSIDPSFRRIFAEGQQILERNKFLTSNSERLEKRIIDLTTRSRDLEKEVGERRREVFAAKTEAAKALKARNDALKTVRVLEKDIAERKKQLVEIKKRSDAAVREAKAADERFVDSMSRLVDARAKLAKTQRDLRTMIGDLTIKKKQLRDTQVNLVSAQKQLKEQEAALRTQEGQLRDQQQALVQTGNVAMDFYRQTSQLRSSELILRQGEEIARATVSCKQSDFGIRGDLLSLLESASDKAKQLGAKVEPNNDRAVFAIFPLDPEHALDESYCVRMARDAIVGSYQDALVQVVCARNTIAGEQVPVEFRLYLNNLIYPKGKFIANTKVDGRMSEARIILSVIDFLQKEVSQAALRAGIIPVANPDPRSTLGRDPGSQFEQLMEVVNRIKAVNARVKLEAFSCDDIHAAGPLNMDNMRFSVTKIE
ncbi:MAG: DUF3084 domain-containing protein [Armatimonadetes bacterium]|nr:DUF3084 domain-containing protein [Armatimonadota bacterium]